MLNYSDKTVSKWERGDGLPDISVLAQISDIFDVTLDYLIHEHDRFEATGIGAIKKRHIRARAIITGLSLLLVWLIATLIFVVVHIAYRAIQYEWLAFIYAIPVTMIVWLILNSIWFNNRRNYIIISLLMWTLFLSLFLTILMIGYNIAVIFVLCIPGQTIILLWASLGHVLRKQKEEAE